jgi:hypothetical protein
MTELSVKTIITVQKLPGNKLQSTITGSTSKMIHLLGVRPSNNDVLFSQSQVQSLVSYVFLHDILKFGVFQLDFLVENVY